MKHNAEHEHMMKKKKRGVGNNNDCGVRDGLNSLPDAILVDILSAMPFKSAVATSVLSSQWRYLWTQLTSLHIMAECHNVFYILHRDVLPRLTSQEIHVFKFSSHPPRDQAGIGTFSAIVRRVCGLRPRKLMIDLDIRCYQAICSCKNFTMLPSCVLESQSLELLSLSRKLDFKLPDSGIISLPNLRKLGISVYPRHREVASKLIKSCPLLEELNLDVTPGNIKQFTIDISSQNLKRLRVYVGVTPHKGSRIVIDAPTLEHLRIQNPSMVTYCCKNRLSNLIKAKVVDYRVLKFEGAWKGLELAQSIKSVQSLSLDSMIFFSYNFYDPYYEVSAEQKIFSRLTKLKLVLEFAIRWEVFMDFLKYCPNLQALEIPDGSVLSHEVNWSELNCLQPTCLSTNVKMITLGRRDKWNLEVLRFFLSAAKVLETFDIDMPAFDNESREESISKQSEFSKELFLFPRASPTCEIKVSGWYLDLSSKDMETGKSVPIFSTLLESQPSILRS